MNIKWFALLIVLSLGLFLVLSGCSPFTNSVSKESPTPLPVTDEPATLTPEQVTEDFYTWYLGYIDQPGSRQMRNPLVDKAYRSSEYLTDAFIRQVDEKLLASERKAYDPFLCAQNIPDCVAVDKAVITGDEASVIVHEIWYGGEVMHDVEVDLERLNGQWRIANISEPPSMSVMSKPPYDLPPKQVVERFYTWYLGYSSQRGFMQIGNPLIDKAYWSCTELTDECVQRVDKMLVSSDTSNLDPFLCVPLGTPITIFIGEAIVSGDEASVVIHTNSFEGHQFTVELKIVDGEWKISNILCDIEDNVESG